MFTSVLKFLSADLPIKTFAQRYRYLDIDTIAVRDLGFVPPPPGQGTGSSNALARQDTVQALMTNSNNQAGGGSGSSQKRPASPDYRKRDDRPAGDYGAGHRDKRVRPLSPSRERDRDNRWDPRRRPRSPGPSWDNRDRDRDGPPPRRIEREREEEKPPVVPMPIAKFIGMLPAPSAFDGKTESNIALNTKLTLTQDLSSAPTI